jgi:hypothetical protein
VRRSAAVYGAAMTGNIIVWTRTGLVLRILLALLLWQHFGFLVTLTAAWPVAGAGE